MNVLDLHDASLVRGTRTILSDFSWIIREGQHWALLGPNGSGKTTLLQLINGYLWPSTGTVTVLGKTFGDYDLRELRKDIGLVSSYVSEKIPDELPALDVVLSGASSTIGLFEVPTRLQIKKARLTLESVGCGSFSKSPYGTLSDGEKQRVLIARALVRTPKLLTLDEPCTGLDIAGREAFLNLLTQMIEMKQDPTIIFATHRIEEIVKAFTHVIMVRGGQIVCAGRKDFILTSRNMTDTFGVNVRVVKHKGRYNAFCP